MFAKNQHAGLDQGKPEQQKRRVSVTEESAFLQTSTVLREKRKSAVEEQSPVTLKVQQGGNKGSHKYNRSFQCK